MHTAVVNVRAKSWYVSTQKEHIWCTLLLKKKKAKKVKSIIRKWCATYMDIWNNIFKFMIIIIIILESFTQHSVCWTLWIIGFIEVTQPNRFLKWKIFCFEMTIIVMSLICYLIVKWHVWASHMGIFWWLHNHIKEWTFETFSVLLI